jgi:hypothetical protein
MATVAPEVLEKEVEANLPMTRGAGIDVQVATAKRYPRSIESFVRRCKEMATLDAVVAASCVYALPRDGKTIEGPSARLAEIVASAWGNMRIQAGTSDQDDRFITARGEAWDVETNVAIGFEVRRRITNRQGQTFNDDMITVTGNAAASIALRNAVFKAVPSAFWKPIYNECRKVIAGDVRTFHARRDDTLKAFMVMGVTTERLLAALGLKGVLDLNLDHMVTLTGIYNALKDGETTIEESFPEGGAATPVKPAQRVSQHNTNAAAAAVAEPQPVDIRAQVDAVAAEIEKTAQPKPSPAAKAHVGVIVDVQDRSQGDKPAAAIVLNTGFIATTRGSDFIKAAASLRDKQSIVELVTTPSSDPAKYAPKLTEIIVVESGEATS